MADDERQWALERFVNGIDELKTVLGPEVGPTIEKTKAELVAGIARRDDGDRDGALVHIARAMAELAGLGERLGGAEGMMMKAVTAAFIQGLARSDRDAIETNLSHMQAESGTPKKPER